jgi:hypothetical protein
VWTWIWDDILLVIWPAIVFELRLRDVVVGAGKRSRWAMVLVMVVRYGVCGGWRCGVWGVVLRVR